MQIGDKKVSPFGIIALVAVMFFAFVTFYFALYGEIIITVVGAIMMLGALFTYYIDLYEHNKPKQVVSG